MAHSTSRRRILDVFSADQHLYTLPGTLNFPKHTHTLDFAIQSSRTGANWVYPPRRRSFVTAADTTCLGLLVSSFHVPTACLATCTVSPPLPPPNQIVSHLILTNSVFSRSPGSLTLLRFFYPPPFYTIHCWLCTLCCTTTPVDSPRCCDPR